MKIITEGERTLLEVTGTFMALIMVIGFMMYTYV